MAASGQWVRKMLKAKISSLQEQWLEQEEKHRSLDRKQRTKTQRKAAKNSNYTLGQQRL